MSAEPISTAIEYEQAASVDEAKQLLDERGHDAKLVAGGQSLMLLLRHGLLEPELLIDIGDIPELAALEEREEKVRIGATATYDAVKSHPLSSTYGCLGDAIDVIAGGPVRKMGTLGGAVSHADPSLDIVPPLISLNARVQVGSVDGTRTLPLEEFHIGFMTSDLDPNELVEQIVFDCRGGRSGSAYLTHSHVKGGWSTVGVSAAVTLSEDATTITDATVALAAVDDSAVRGVSVEDRLEGRSISDGVEDAAEAVVDDISPLTDISGSAEYKRDLSAVLTQRSLRKAIERAGGQL